MVFGLIKTGIKAASNYTAGRFKERTTALGGGIGLTALYFRTTKPEIVTEEMFYIVFGVAMLMAVLKSGFMKSVGEACLERARRKTMRKRFGK